MIPLISVIVPVYNTKEYLQQCLDSIVNQTYRNLEIILIDDGSSDGSEKIVDEYKTDERVIIIHQTNAGESNARNTGIKIAKGDYIAFVDCDDWLELDMYENLMEKAICNDVDIVACSWFKDYEDKSLPMINKGEVIAGTFDKHQLMYYVYRRDEFQSFAYMWDKVYKRNLIYGKDDVLLFDESLKLGGDVLYLGQLILQSDTASYIEESKYHYRQRPESGCHTNDIEIRLDWLRAYELLIKEYNKANVPQNIMLWIKRFLAYHASNVAEMSINQNNTGALEIARNIMKHYERDYVETNEEYPDRIERFGRLLNDRG